MTPPDEPLHEQVQRVILEADRRTIEARQQADHWERGLRAEQRAHARTKDEAGMARTRHLTRIRELEALLAAGESGSSAYWQAQTYRERDAVANVRDRLARCRRSLAELHRTHHRTVKGQASRDRTIAKLQTALAAAGAPATGPDGAPVAVITSPALAELRDLYAVDCSDADLLRKAAYEIRDLRGRRMHQGPLPDPPRLGTLIYPRLADAIEAMRTELRALPSLSGAQVVEDGLRELHRLQAEAQRRARRYSQPLTVTVNADEQQGREVARLARLVAELRVQAGSAEHALDTLRSAVRARIGREPSELVEEWLAE